MSNNYANRKKYIPELATDVSNDVSGYSKTKERSISGLIAQSGKPLLDKEINLLQDLITDNTELNKWLYPSGFLHSQSKQNRKLDYKTVDGSAIGESTLIDSFLLPKLEAVVAGKHLTIEYSNTDVEGYNKVELSPATVYDGTPGNTKRTDFVFLEVWYALIGADIPAKNTITILDNASLSDGDEVVLNGTTLTARSGSPSVDEFEIGATATDTALNISDAINNPSNSFTNICIADPIGEDILLTAAFTGASGNILTLTTSNGSAIGLESATFIDGESKINKPNDGFIYRHGNVLSPPPTWLEEDLVDLNLGVETSLRVQLQYRIRTSEEGSNCNIKAYPDGFSTQFSASPTILAQGSKGTPNVDYPFVPADNVSTWLSSDASAYGDIDSGLWIAGDGSEDAALDLGTVDGFVYAIPICFVFRHNNASDSVDLGFDPLNNTNGAPLSTHSGYTSLAYSVAIPAGVSDRPDNQFCDVVVDHQILDMRKHIVPSGLDFNNEALRQIQALQDLKIETWAIDTDSKGALGNGSGDFSTHPLVCNEIGRLDAQGGVSPASGDTDRGVAIRNFDHIARRFASQPIIERVVFAFYPGDRHPSILQGGVVGSGTENEGKYVVKAESAPGVPISSGGWYAGDELNLDLTSFLSTTLGNIFSGGDGDGGSGTGLPSETFETFAPSGTVISDVIGAWHDDGHSITAISQDVQFSSILGLGTLHIQCVLDGNNSSANGGGSIPFPYTLVPISGPTSSSTRRIFLEVEITYPSDVGTTDTVWYECDPDNLVYDGVSGYGPGPIVENDVTQRPSDMLTLIEPKFRTSYREVQLEYLADSSDTHGVSTGTVISDTIVSRDRTTLYFPRRVFSETDLTVTDNLAASAKTIDTSLSEFGSSSRKIIVDSNLSGTGQTICDIEYYAQDPIPNYGASGGGYQVGVYFRTHAPQTAGVKEGSIHVGGSGLLPNSITVEPLGWPQNLWSCQVGVASQDRGFPYNLPCELIPTSNLSLEESFFMATTDITVQNFETNAGMITLNALIQSDIQGTFTFGGVGAGRTPMKDNEFRALYPYAANTEYRPMLSTFNLDTESRHKVFTGFLARVVEAEGSTLFRPNEVVLVVLSTYFDLDDQNTIKFQDTGNNTVAAIYKTQNNLLVSGVDTNLS